MDENEADGDIDVAPIWKLWRPGAEPPGWDDEHKPWGFSVAAEGRYIGGNSEGKVVGVNAEANHIMPDDFSVKLHAASRYNNSGGKVSEHNVSGGIDSDLFISKHFGVYAREELSTDRANDIRLRSTSAAGGEYFIFQKPVPGGLEMLRLRTGLGCRYEKHRAPGADSSSDMTADFGLRFYKRFSDVFAWTTETTYTPAVRDFADYRVSHESKCTVDLVKDWRVSQEFGVINGYNSHPAADNEKTDTTVYMRIKKTW